MRLINLNEKINRRRAAGCYSIELPHKLWLLIEPQLNMAHTARLKLELYLNLYEPMIGTLLFT